MYCCFRLQSFLAFVYQCGSQYNNKQSRYSNQIKLPQLDLPSMMNLSKQLVLYEAFYYFWFSYRSIQERSDDYVHNSNNDCQPHFSLRLPCYLRGTSPLQRYVDLVNQRQIVAAIEQRNCTLPSELCGKNVTNA